MRRPLSLLILGLFALPGLIWAAQQDGILLIDDFEGDGPKLGSSWEKYTDDPDKGLGTKVTFEIEKGGPKTEKGHAHFSGHMGKSKEPWPYAIMELSFGNDGPKDVSTYKALRFYAKGDGKKHRVSLSRAAVEDYCHYEYVFTAPKDWTLIVAPLDNFKQPTWGKKVEKGWKDVTGVRFLACNTGDDEDFDLRWDDVAFTPTLPAKK